MKPYQARLCCDAAGEWRWRIEAPNGRVVADSGEGCKTRAGALRAIRTLLETPVEVLNGGPPEARKPVTKRLPQTRGS